MYRLPRLTLSTRIQRAGITQSLKEGSFASVTRHKSTYRNRSGPQAQEASVPERRANRNAPVTQSPTVEEQSAKRTSFSPLLVKQIPFDYDPFQTSAFVQAYLKQGLNKKYSVSGADLSVERLDKLYALVQKASKRSVNSVVWNMLIRAFGDAKRYNKMFDIYNDMKKRGIKPTTRTWGTLLTYFPKTLQTSPEKVLSRYTLIYDEAQAKLAAHLNADEQVSPELAEGLEEVELASTSTPFQQHLRTEPEAFERPQFVTNQYIQLLAHFERYDEILRVLTSMPQTGEGAPDAITYTVIFNALMNRGANNADGSVSNEKSAVRSVWEKMIEQQKSLGEQKAKPVLDNQNAILGLRALSTGSEADRNLAFVALPRLFGMSRPGESVAAQSSGNLKIRAPLELNERAVETILTLCLGLKRDVDASHYVRQFLARKPLVAQFSGRHWQLIMAALANAHDREACEMVLERFGPAVNQSAWPYQCYASLFKSAKWTRDFDGFMRLLEKHVKLPSAYQVSEAVLSEKGRQLRQIVPTLEIAVLMLETALASKQISSIRRALRVSAVMKEGDLIFAEEHQQLNDHSQGRGSQTQGSPDQDLRQPNKSQKQIMFWRQRRNERLIECTAAALRANHIAVQGSTPAEEAAWRRTADEARQALSAGNQPYVAPALETRSPPRNMQQWRETLRGAEHRQRMLTNGQDLRREANLASGSRTGFVPPMRTMSHRSPVQARFKSTDSSSEIPAKEPPLPKLLDKDGNPPKIEPKLSLTFTCSVENCGERSTHEFTKRSYTKGIVIVQCPGCKNRHLIADHLGWFNESTGDGKFRTIEDLMREKGEKVRRGRLGQDGDIEIDE